MSTALYNLGRYLSRHKIATVLTWLMIIVLSVAAAVLSGGKFNDNLSIPGTEAQEGLEVLAERFPQVSGASGQLLLQAPDGADIRDYRTDIEQIVADGNAIEDVAIVSNPFEEGGASSFSLTERTSCCKSSLMCSWAVFPMRPLTGSVTLPTTSLRPLTSRLMWVAACSR